MKRTNKHNLPSVFERFGDSFPYSTEGAKYGATTLLDSPRIRRLRQNHFQEIEEDIADSVFSLLGTAIHAILEGGSEPDQIVEERFHAEVEVNGEKIGVSGQVDLQTPTPNGMILSDYKTTSSSAVMYNPEGKSEHHKQLNLYAAMARRNGVKVAGLEIISIVRDWTASGLNRYQNYPEASVVITPIPLWGCLKAEKYLRRRVALHESSAIPECTPEERWAKATTWAVFEKTKAGTVRKRATKVFDNEIEADLFAKDKGASVVERPGSFARCEGNYCGVAEFCEQFQKEK